MLRQQLLLENSDYVQVEQVLGPQAALRLARFRDGGRYVRVGEWVLFKAWLVDLVVVLAGVSVGALVLAVANRTADLDNATMAVLIVLMLPLVSFLYGAWYGDGRALGAVLTGIQFVRAADGGRIGAKGPWAMLVRIALLPLAILFQIVGTLGSHTGGGPVGVASIRVGVDVHATRQLRAVGII